MSRKAKQHTKEFKLNAIAYRKEHPDCFYRKNSGNALYIYSITALKSW